MAVDHSTRYRLNRNWLHQFRRLGVRWERPELHEAGMHLHLPQRASLDAAPAG